MADSLVHRGPDDDGYWDDSDIALGFRRLSIVDLEGGAQPMPNEDGTVIVVFNGEIYNHVPLRRELEAAGHRFRSDHSDTEVLVHGYEEWGEALVPRLNGIFAFAVWDQGAESLFLARDRFGVKPLYLAGDGSTRIVFGSELRALFASGLVEKRGSATGLLEYLSLQNNWAGRTPFEGVELFPAAHYERITRDSRRRTEYWDYRFDRSHGQGIDTAAEQHREILLDVMKRQMQADVPVMSYLSGGIDSTAVTAAAHRLDRDVRSYSCIFNLDGVGDDKISDEREFSRAAASSLGIDRVEVELPQRVLEQTLDRTIAALEYPRMGMAYVNYLIAQRVADDAKVVLSGMGGDELHGGYLYRYQLVPRQTPRSLRDLLHPRHIRSLRHPRRMIRNMLAPRPEMTDPLGIFRQILNSPIQQSQWDTAFTPEFLRAANGFSPRAEIEGMVEKAPSRDPWDVVMYVDAKTYMHGLLVIEDKLSMIHSLETRVPLLDNDLVDFVLGLPWKLLCDGNQGKIVFRQSVKPWVPRVIYEKPKMGFGPPDASWYRGALRPWIEKMLSPRLIAARGVLQPRFVANVLEGHFSGRVNHVATIWSLLSMESWCRQHGMFGGDLRSQAAV